MDIPTIAQLAHRYHAPQEVFIVGTGTSLSGFAWDRLRDRVTVGLNDVVLRFTPTYHIYVDANLWERYRDLPMVGCHGVVTQHNGAKHLLYYPHCRYKDRVYAFTKTKDIRDCRVDNEVLYSDYTVASAALLLAWKLGASVAYLLGVDGYLVECWKGNRHWFAKYHTDDIGGHTRHSVSDEAFWYSKEVDSVYDYMRARGLPLEVFQLSKDATTRVIPKRDVNEVL